jgi:hypothetical protein
MSQAQLLRFKKNPKTWNLGIPVTPEVKLKISLGNLGKKKSGVSKANSQRLNNKHPKWKGNKASYRAIHIWIENRLGKPRFCEKCGNRDLKHRQYHWSNINGNYKRIIGEWRRLCVKCHKEFDKNNRVVRKKY